ncbi:MAG: chromosome segregation protein SMC [Cyclobacteriaceae bacterium]|nr:chromosome segregation protein SMC [Cyclobacteriaceae bacterium]
MTQEVKIVEPVKPKVKPAKKNNKIAIIIALLTIVVVVQSVKIFLDAQKKVELMEQNEAEQKELASTIQRLNEIRIELDEKILEIESLGGDISELELTKKEIEEELNRTRTQNRSTINQLRAKVEGYEELLLAKDKEIEELEKLNEVLYSENTDLKTERNQLNRTITELNESKTELESKVEEAGQLKVEDIEIWAIGSRGRERTTPFRARQLNQLKIIFNVAENKVAPIEGKNIMIRVLDPQDNVIFDVNKGSGTFMYQGKEEFYTANQEILYDRTQQQLTFLYDKESLYENGNYSIEIYTDDYLMGKSEFVVK